MEKRQSWWGTLTCAGQGLTPRDRRNQWVATGWIFFWALSFVLATFLLTREAVPGASRWAVALLPTALGVGTIIVFHRFLAQADELQRKIQTDGLAFGFGTGVVGSVGMRLVELAGGPVLDVSDSVPLMVVAYALAVLVGTRRYS